jgi:hypothetical protein
MKNIFAAVLCVFMLSACIPKASYKKQDMASHNQDHSSCDFEGIKARSAVPRTNNGLNDGYNQAGAYNDVYAACMRMKGYTKTYE